MLPIQLLTKELNTLIKSKDKSIKSCVEGKIRIKLHTTHIRNLNPMIERYKTDIEKLKIK